MCDFEQSACPRKIILNNKFLLSFLCVRKVLQQCSKGQRDIHATVGCMPALCRWKVPLFLLMLLCTQIRYYHFCVSILFSVKVAFKSHELGANTIRCHKIVLRNLKEWQFPYQSRKIYLQENTINSGYQPNECCELF